MIRGRTHKRIERRLNRLRRLFAHLALTLIVVLTINWSVDRLGAPPQIENDITPVVVLFFIAHALWITYQEASHFIVQQEAARERQNDLPEKPKRHLALDDDGELTEILFDEEIWDEKAKRAE